LDLGSNVLRLATSLGVRSFLGMGVILGVALGLVRAAKPPGHGFPFNSGTDQARQRDRPNGVRSASRV
jgi:hypothetical protein